MAAINRGKNGRCLSELKAIQKMRRMDLSSNSETKLWGSKAIAIKTNLGFTNGTHVDCEGRSGGMLLMWDEEWRVDI
ncbi:hypothetical protein TorRG33x02_171390 [Trema orientale]|uniref:Uncharacterized protein n=1 Tax=Trema orientale TaxID=63057 RepID=A0A2P5ENB9_TREOI|nr:hypothetical protein TorRG33x02_171390 [Trema orientale]